MESRWSKHAARFWQAIWPTVSPRSAHSNLLRSEQGGFCIVEDGVGCNILIWDYTTKNLERTSDICRILEGIWQSARPGPSRKAAWIRILWRYFQTAQSGIQILERFRTIWQYQSNSFEYKIGVGQGCQLSLLLYITWSEEIPSLRCYTKRERGNLNLFNLIVLMSSYDRRVISRKGRFNCKNQ